MGYETERKFLVKGEFLKEATGKTEIVQAYLLVDTRRTIRIRLAGEDAYLTIKSKAATGSIRRGEWEFRIPADEAIELFPLCLPGRIVKTRYFIPAGAHTFEVDVFHEGNEGLIIAEVELSDESESFLKPDWLGEEVTGNPAYYNSNLLK